MAKQESSLVVYQAKGGDEVKLSLEIVRDFLVTGKKELVTVQEMMFFIGICKARGLNPFAKDCYLIKYSQDPAAIITAIGFYQSRAKAQPDCQGWERGVIVLNKDTKELRYSKGLVLDNEDVVGGWFKAQPEGWAVPFELEVNLREYLKHTASGEVTKFWKNPAMMIAKVAESQGLRTLWPDEFRGTITGEEAGLQLDQIEAMDIGGLPAPETETKKAPPAKIDTTKFAELVLKQGLDEERVKRLEVFIKTTAASQKRKKISPEELMTKAADNFPAFWAAFEKWESLSFPPPQQQPKPEATKPEPIKSPEPVGSTDGGNPPLFAGEDPGEGGLEMGGGPAIEPTSVVPFTDRLMSVWQDAIDKGIPMTQFSGLGITKRADVTPDNIDRVEQIVGDYKAKK